jgi:hypothetical protein
MDRESVFSGPMADSPLVRARSALADCDAVVQRLHKLCCEPDRSPEMAAIEDSLAVIRQDIATDDPDVLHRSLDNLADIGARLGFLQVGCCAPVRMPLYADALRHLNNVQLGLTQTLGRAH